MSGYQHTTGGMEIDIREAVGGAQVRVAPTDGGFRDIVLPPAERPKAAAALAGDGYEVVEKIADWEREFLARQYADPGDVQVGWVVEVSTTRQGTVTEVMPGDVRYLFRIDFGDGDPELVDGQHGEIAVRVVSRPDEPDRAQVQALTDVLDDAGSGDIDNRRLARELVRRGVRAPEATLP